MIINFMAEKLIISFDEYTQIVEKLAIQIHENYKPTVLVGIMRGAAPIIDILSRILKLPIAYIVIQSYSGKGLEDQQGQLMFAREISSLANNKDFNKVLLIDDLSDTGLTLNKSIEWNDVSESAPAILAMIAMPLTYSISNGIALAFVSYALIKIFTGKFATTSPAIWVIAILSVVSFAVA